MAFFFLLLLFVATFILSELLRPSPNQEEGQAGLGDFRFPTATENRSVPLIWGTVKIDGPNVVWYGDLTQQAIIESVSTGLFSSEDVTKGFRYFIGVQFAWCRGPIDSLHRIWIGDEEVFNGTQAAGTLQIDSPELFGGDDFGNGGVTGDFTVFLGDQAQAASSYLSDFQKEPPTTGDTPAYRGTAYGVFEAGYIGNSTQIKPWAFEVRRIPDGAQLFGLDAIVNGADANPVNVLYEILTNDEWGLNFPAADIDIDNFRSVGDILETEGNGFSMILDRPTEMIEILRLIERQIDGMVFLNRITGKWTIKLVRNDYTIGSVPQVDSTNLIEVEDFTRGAWQDTVNHVRTSFIDRSRDYFGTYAQAQDMANIRVQGGANVTVTLNYPGVKDATLANNLAWRDLRSLSYPLAKAKLTVDRTFFDVNPGDVVAFTGTIGEEDFVQLPLRISKIDLGQLTEGKIILDVVQDVFQFAQPSFGDPPPTGWTPPVDTLVPFPAAEELAFEAPFAFVKRDPKFPNQRTRVWAAGRFQFDGATLFDIRTRHSFSNPTGSYFTVGTVTAFMLIAELENALDKSPLPHPMTFFNITATPDLKSTIQAAIGGTASASQIGVGLVHLCLIGTEFIAFTNQGNDPGGNEIRIDNIYRGMLDSVPQDHAAGATVYLIFVGGGLTDSSYPDLDDVDTKLLPRSPTDQVAEGTANEIAFVGVIRDKLPYPPSQISLDFQVYQATHDMDGGGGGLDARGPNVRYIRRDFKTNDEVLAIFDEEPNLDAATEYRMQVINDPDGSPSNLYLTDWVTGDLIHLSRTEVLRATLGVLTTRLRLEIQTRHTFEDHADVQALQDLAHDFDTDYDTIDNDTNLGKLPSGTISPTYTVPEAGTYDFTIGTDVLTGGAILEARINGGSFTTIMTAGQTTGTLAGLVVSDTIEVRHTQSTNIETFLQIDAPTNTAGAYGILVESGG